MELKQLRSKLDEIDNVLVQTLGLRFQICRRIARLKQDASIPMMQMDRIKFVMEHAEALAVQHDVRPEFIRKAYELIINESCCLESEIMATESNLGFKLSEAGR
jgi:4-amino-4-deoxychorismate mutase